VNGAVSQSDSNPLFVPGKVVAALGVLHEPGTVFEVRALNVAMKGQRWRRNAVSGFFNSPEAVIPELQRIEAAAGIYVTMNPVLPDLLNRAINRINDRAATGFATKDTDIVRRRWLLIDCDPLRPKGISATGGELAKGRGKAREIRDFLKESGWNSPVCALSGNGVHLLYRVDLPADDGGLLKKVLLALARKFDDAGVDVDKSVHNPSRITKLYGTQACKGDPTEDRPHRLSELIAHPENIAIVAREQLEAVAALGEDTVRGVTQFPPVPDMPFAAVPAVPESPSTRESLVLTAPGPGNWDPHAFVAQFIAKHGISVSRTEDKGGDTYHMLELCPWAAEHGGTDKPGDAAIVVKTDGQLGFKCFHSHCANRHWRDFRLFHEPDYEQARSRGTRIYTPVGITGADPDSAALQVQYFQILNTKGLEANEKYKRMAAATIAALNARGRFYFHAELKDFATAMWFDGTRRLLLNLSSDEWAAWLSEWTGLNRVERAFAFIQSEVETESLAGKTTEGIVPSEYWASSGDAVYLSNGNGEMVKMTADKVELCLNGTDGILFASGRTLTPWKLTDPVDPFESCRLFRECATSAAGHEILKLYALSMVTNQRCKPPLVLTGPIGSGKTRVGVGLFELFGIPPRVVAVTELGEDDFWTQINAGGSCCFDNADTRIKWLPDALAAAATAGTHEKRQLYTDSRIVTQRARAWVMVTSANPTFASDAGLADRLLVVRLERRVIETAEAALSTEIAANRDAGLSWIAKAISVALADHNPVPGSLNRRHPDWATMAVRLGRAIGREEQAIGAIRSAEADKSLFNIQNDDIGATILEIVAERGQWSGTSAELLSSVTEKDTGLAGKLTVKRLGKRLAKLWPHLESVLQGTKVPHRDGILTYAFTLPAGFAGYAGFQVPLSDNLSRENENIGLMENAPRNPANPAPALLNVIAPPYIPLVGESRFPAPDPDDDFLN